jgi:quercetin dioxygenase-like cupin family protein
MTTTVLPAKPKTLAPDEGEKQSLLTHTITWKLTAFDTNDRYAMFEVIDTTGGSAPLHSHPWEETFYILEGELEIQIGNRRETIGAGSVSHIPANAVHAFKIVSPVAILLVIVSPAVAEAFYREAGEKLTSFPPDPIVLKEFREKYDFQLCP